MKDKYILGISAFYHDSSACLLLGDEIIAAAAEERFTRIKHDESFPENAIIFCLNRANITLDQVEFVTFYEKPLITFERIIDTYFRNSPFGFTSFKTSAPIWLKNKLFIRNQITDSLVKISNLEKDKLPKLLFSSHHLSHAASAFYPSPFKSAAILCMDGVGEYSTTSLWTGQGKELKLLKQINFPHSIGLLYSAFTYYCGFKVNDGEYKLMGLAPYGSPKYSEVILKNLITIYKDGSYKLNTKYFDYETGLKMTNSHFNKLFNFPARKPESELTQFYMDIAASIQEVTEIVIENLCAHIKEITNEEYLCLSGGVALNCVANGRILKKRLFKDIWIQPASSDCGSSLGAAFATLYNKTELEREITFPDKMNNCYLGTEYSKNEIQEYLEGKQASYKYLDNTNELLQKTSDLIIDDKVIGWFQGRSEFGPRALGSRSILGNAKSSSLQRDINLKIKFRESFRPFAPVVIADDAHQIFDEIKNSPYMLLVDQISKEHIHDDLMRDKDGLEKLRFVNSNFPAITHVNNTARIQTVSAASNPLFYDLLNKIKDKIGLGILINTSFNVRSEPIINSPDDAYKCFMKTDMDYLVLGNFLLSKEDQPQKIDSKSINTNSLPIMSHKELIIFWIKFLVFVTIVFYITLPYFELVNRTLYPGLLGALPLIVSLIIPQIMYGPTKYFLSFLHSIQNFINLILLFLVFYFVFTPYSMIVKIFVRDPENKSSNWSQAEQLKLNDKMF